MSNRRPLTKAEIDDALTRLAGWSYENGKLHREFQFADFVHAFRFMTAVALTAEAHNHHPEWFNVYNRVVVDLSTHDVGGVSPKDVALAEAMDALAG